MRPLTLSLLVASTAASDLDASCCPLFLQCRCCCFCSSNLLAVAGLKTSEQFRGAAEVVALFLQDEEAQEPRISESLLVLGNSRSSELSSDSTSTFTLSCLISFSFAFPIGGVFSVALKNAGNPGSFFHLSQFSKSRRPCNVERELDWGLFLREKSGSTIF